MTTVVERELELKLVLSPERTLAVPARLSYDAGDPFAARITFHTGTADPVTWTFARDLLIEGVFRPAGHGDVRVWPLKVDGATTLCIALISPHGDALLEAPLAVVCGWIERTLAVVPPGYELDEADLDRAINRLLAGSPRRGCHPSAGARVLPLRERRQEGAPAPAPAPEREPGQASSDQGCDQGRAQGRGQGQEGPCA